MKNLEDESRGSKERKVDATGNIIVEGGDATTGSRYC